MTRRANMLHCLILCGCGLFALTGCAAGNVRFTGPAIQRDMSHYNSAAIRVINDAGTKCRAGVPENLQASAIRQLRKYAGAFEDVRPVPTGQEHELLIEVHITKYNKGSRVARSILIGLGPSRISTEIHVKDSASGTLLRSGKLDLLWALGGTIGASKGIEDLVDESGRKIADAIFKCKTVKTGKRDDRYAGARK